MQRHDGTSIDWEQCLLAAANHFRGESNPRLSSPQRGELRWGARGSLAVRLSPSPAAGAFYDFEADVGGGVLAFLRHEAGMDKGSALRWLREQGLISPSSRPPGRAPTGRAAESGRTPRSTSADSQGRDSEAYGRRLWQQSEAVPAGPAHPSRLWMAARTLWRPECQLPDAVRWLPADTRHQGAGSLIVPLAPLSAWQDSWPSVLVPIAFHTVAIDDQGQKSADRSVESGGQPKRSYGAMAGSIFLIGNPHISESRAPVQVCEGLADALAVAARFEGPVISGLGTPARLARDNGLVQALAAAPHGVVIYADNDAGGTGQRAAAALRLAVNSRGGNARAVVVRDGKDPADQSKRLPFGPLHEAWQDYARTLEDMHPAWPIWEIYRQADIATQQEDK